MSVTNAAKRLKMLFGGVKIRINCSNDYCVLCEINDTYWHLHYSNHLRVVVQYLQSCYCYNAYQTCNFVVVFVLCLV